MLLRGNNYAFARQYLWCCRLLVFGCRLLVFGCRYWLPAKATDNLQPITDNLQPITDNLQPTTYNLLFIDILFLNNQTTSFVWKTVPCRCMLIAFLYVLVLSSRQLFSSCP